MKAIDRKLLRDLWKMRGQAIAIVFVILSGVAAYVSMASVMDALQQSLQSYYKNYRFAHGFASVRRAPEHLTERIQKIPGLSLLTTRVAAGVNLKIEGFEEPVSGLIMSIPEENQPDLNRLFIREGRLVQVGHENEVLLNEPFAQAHGLSPGDQITAIINGRYKKLRVVGIALSPEFLMQIKPGSIFPDPKRFGVMWMGRTALAAAYDMDGAFNDIAFTVAPGTNLDDVINGVDLLLKSYGGKGAYGRDLQPSHFIISEEFRQLRGTATILPIVFLAVAAFLLNMAITRLISLQREQIAVLKAFGYQNRDIGWHYIKLVLLIAFAGTAAGILLGIWLGKGLGNLYLEFYRFPSLEYELRFSIVLTSIILTSGASLAGVMLAVYRAIKLPPAEAMKPEPPPVYRSTSIERMGLQRYFDQPTRMILRNLERRPIKALLTIVGISSAGAILILGLFFADSFDYVIRIQFGLAQRENLTVSFTDPTSMSAIFELKHLPGVYHAEPVRSVPVRLRYGHRHYQTSIEGIYPDAYLRQLISTDLDPVSVPREGIIITDQLSRILNVQPGNMIHVEVLEGKRHIRNIPVVGIVQQFIGVGAYMDFQAANTLSGIGQAITGALLLIDKNHEIQLMQMLTQRPRVADVSSQQRIIEAFYETSAKTMLTYTFILSLFAGVIAFGVVYNSARISLSERDRELASLRILGFTKNEIAYILLGELAVLTLISVPIGLFLGSMAGASLVETMKTDMYQLPFVIGKNTLALASSIVLLSAVVSSMIVYRKLKNLDLIAVLKTRA